MPTLKKLTRSGGPRTVPVVCTLSVDVSSVPDSFYFYGLRPGDHFQYFVLYYDMVFQFDHHGSIRFALEVGGVERGHVVVKPHMYL